MQKSFCWTHLDSCKSLLCWRFALQRDFFWKMGILYRCRPSRRIPSPSLLRHMMWLTSTQVEKCIWKRRSRNSVDKYIWEVHFGNTVGNYVWLPSSKIHFASSVRHISMGWMPPVSFGMAAPSVTRVQRSYVLALVHQLALIHLLVKLSPLSRIYIFWTLRVRRQYLGTFDPSEWRNEVFHSFPVVNCLAGWRAQDDWNTILL